MHSKKLLLWKRDKFLEDRGEGSVSEGAWDKAGEVWDQVDETWDGDGQG